MSLILGLHLLNKLYLVSDTRVTSTKNKTHSYEDNQLKFEAINPQISVVAAGDGHLAAYVVSELKKAIPRQSRLSRSDLEKEIEKIAREYVEKFYKFTTSVFIFTGFSNKQGKTVNSTTLGDVMSAYVKEHGAAQQSIHKEITKALVSEISKRGILRKNDPITIDTTDSVMFSAEIDTKAGTIKTELIKPYEYSIFHPGYKNKPLPIPKDVISHLEFRNISGMSAEDVLYQDAEILTNFVNKTVRENGFDSVGGHIMITLQTLNTGLRFPTGDLGKVQNGVITYAGSIYVENGNICYKLPDGKQGVYKKLESLLSTNLKLETKDLSFLNGEFTIITPTLKYAENNV
jgi:hypothetical protein